MYVNSEGALHLDHLYGRDDDRRRLRQLFCAIVDQDFTLVIYIAFTAMARLKPSRLCLPATSNMDSTT